LLPSNPIQDSFELLNADRSDNTTYSKNNKQENTNTIQKKEQLLFPNFTQFHPHHLPSAFVRASRLTQSRWNQFQQSLSNYLKYYPEQKLPYQAIVGERYQLSACIEYLVSLQNLYYTLVGSKDWKRVCSQIPLEANWESDNLRMALEHLYQALPNNKSDSNDNHDDKDDDDDTEDRRYVIYKLLLLYRLHSVTALDSVDLVKLRYRISELERIFRDPSRRSGNAKTATVTSAGASHATTNHTLLLEDMAEYFILKQDLARSRGMDTFADWILKDRLVDRFKLLSLLKKVSNQADKALERIALLKQGEIIPNQDQEVENPASDGDNESKRSDKVRLEEPPSYSLPLVPSAISFELESVLETMFRLVESLFGVVIDEEENVNGWHPDVRLFHVYEESSVSASTGDNEKGAYLGSFYLDPLARPGKEETITSLVLFLGSRTVPILATHATTIANETTLVLPYVAALFKTMGGAIQSILAGPVLVGFYNRHVHLQDIEPIWKNVSIDYV
jgi:hypothetical protein